jgi:hypothetical protein
MIVTHQSEDEQEPYIQEMVKDVSEKDDSDKAAYKEKLRAKRQKRKERMLKRRTQKKELLSSQGVRIFPKACRSRPCVNS